MKFFTKSFMNGATLFGIGLAILGLQLGLDLGYLAELILAVVGYLYLIISVIAFLVPSLSE